MYIYFWGSISKSQKCKYSYGITLFQVGYCEIRCNSNNITVMPKKSWQVNLSPDTIKEFYSKMADVPALANLNEAALKRFDPYVKEILDKAKFVALFSYNPEEEEWEKINVEGSLFLYSRTGEPYYNILVLNRLNTKNLIEPISSKLDIQLHEQFLIYLNTKFCIYGIWFYEKEECTRLGTLIEELMKQLGGNKRSPTSVNTNGGESVDIVSMLSKAQEVYNSSKSPSSENKNVSNKVNLPEVDQTPQSVMDFFAKAGSAPQKTSVSTGGTSRFVLGRSQSMTAQESSEKSPLNPLIHQLMSDPVHSVEHIEKQQRSVTPQTYDSANSQLLKKIIRPSSTQLEVESQAAIEDASKKNFKLENGLNNLNYIRMSSPSYQSFFGQPAADSTEFRSISGPKTGLETPQKPALMPPAMFTPSVSKEPLMNESFNFRDNDQNQPALLTKSQLLQAINYLLKNDPDFVTKIHEAYIRSLTDKVL